MITDEPAGGGRRRWPALISPRAGIPRLRVRRVVTYKVAPGPNRRSSVTQSINQYQELFMSKLILALAMALSIGFASAQAAPRLQDANHTFPGYDNQIGGGPN